MKQSLSSSPWSRNSVLLSLLLLAACQSPNLPPSNPSRVQSQTAGAQAPAGPVAPLQISYRRLIYGMFEAPAQKDGSLTGLQAPWTRPLLDPVALLAAASGESGLLMAKEPAALSAKGLKVALGDEAMLVTVGTSDMSIARRIPAGIAMGQDTIQLGEHSLSFTAYGTNARMQLLYTDNEAELTGRVGTYSAKLVENGALVQTPRGAINLTKADGKLLVHNSLHPDQDTTITEQETTVAVDRPMLSNDFTVIKQGPRIQVQTMDPKKNFTLERQPGRIVVTYPNDRERSYTIELLKDQIKIDRDGWLQDYEITRKAESVSIDRWFYANDATIKLKDKSLTRRHWFGDRDAAFNQGVQATSYTFEEDGMTIQVGPEGMQLQAMALDNGIDVLF